MILSFPVQLEFNFLLLLHPFESNRQLCSKVAPAKPVWPARQMVRVQHKCGRHPGGGWWGSLTARKRSGLRSLSGSARSGSPFRCRPFSTPQPAEILAAVIEGAVEHFCLPYVSHFATYSQGNGPLRAIVPPLGK